MPAHNESANLRWLLPHLGRTLPRLAGEFEVVIVDDGSVDGTEQVAEELGRQLSLRLKVIRHPSKQGYGSAVGDGLRAADLEYAAFLDADGQLDPADLALLLPALERADLVAGWRRSREDPALRSLVSGVFNLLVRVLFRLPVRDVDCALKVVRTDVLRRFELRARSAVINAELYYKVRRSGGSFEQVPVPHHARRLGRRSGARLVPILRAIRDLVRLRVQTWSSP